MVTHVAYRAFMIGNWTLLKSDKTVAVKTVGLSLFPQQQLMLTVQQENCKHWTSVLHRYTDLYHINQLFSFLVYL